MGDTLLDTPDAAALVQFLRECEPLTPPASTLQTAFAFSHELLESERGQMPSGTPSSNSGGLQLEEVDKQAILQALDAYNESTEPSPVLRSNTGRTEGQDGGQMINRGDKTDASDVSAEKAFKLAVKRAKAAKRRNRHRERVKAEWETLRRQRTQLSAQLEALERSRVSGVSGLKWQARASKELNARLQAEGQQQNLIAAIDHRAAAMQNLHKAWRQYASGNGGEPQQEWGSADFEMFENFMFEIDAEYARTDEVLHESGLAETVPWTTSYYTPARKWDALRGFEYFESTSAFVMPSKYPKSANVMFECMRQVHRQNAQRKLHEEVRDLPNTVAVKFGTVFHAEMGNIVPLSLIFVIRRYVEANRTVLVWRGVIENDGKFAGTYLNSTGWSMLRPTSTGNSGTMDSTDVRTCEFTVPVHLRPVGKIKDYCSAPDAQSFAEIAIRSAQLDMLTLTHLMAKTLLEDRYIAT